MAQGLCTSPGLFSFALLLPLCQLFHVIALHINFQHRETTRSCPVCAHAWPTAAFTQPLLCTNWAQLLIVSCACIFSLLADLEPFQKRLAEIRQLVDTEAAKEEEDDKRSDCGVPKPEILLVSRRLRQCEKELSVLEEATRIISNDLMPTYEELVSIRRRLTTLSFVVHDVAIVEAKELQRRLIEIDDLRVSDRFVNADDGMVAEGQTQVVGLLEECFDCLHDLMAEGNAVSKDLMPLYDRLMEIRVQLEKLLLTSRWTLRETDLWSYQVQLQDIDAMRRNGQFKDASGEPAPQQAQAVLNFLLHKCYNLVYKLLSSSEPVAESLMP
ncbi:hypothetical protein IWW47_003184, partial [Coemansia sp. RSA 2052]